MNVLANSLHTLNNMNEPNNAPEEGQSTEQLAASLFGEINPDIESGTRTEEVQNGPEVVAEPEVIAEPEAVVAQPVAQVAPVQPTYTQEQIAQFQEWQNRQVSQRVQQPVAVQQPTPPPAPLPDEEVAKLTNRFTMTEKEFDAIYEAPDKPSAVKAFNDVLQRTVMQAVTMANYLAQDHAGKVLEKAQPYMQFAESQRNLMLHETFYSQHPDLRGADVIVQAVMGNMTQQGIKFQSEKQLFDAIAQASKAQLAKLGKTGQSTVPVNGKVKQPMASLPTGSQGGTRVAAVGSGSQNTARSLFG